jgi:YD repeat-containing protein
MTQMKFTQNLNIFYTETRSYNARLQLTQIATTYTTTNLNMQYVYSTTQNNGQVTQAIDSVSGETIDYTYDSLNRLITAATTGPQWGLNFGYDGFGNRLTQTVTKGTAPASSVSVNASTNRINSSGYVYDSNGNLTTMPYGAGSMTLTYDVENRVIQAVNSNGTEQYGYSPDNRRVYQKQPRRNPVDSLLRSEWRPAADLHVFWQRRLSSIEDQPVLCGTGDSPKRSGSVR